jgi:CDP-L-myo-inositol myo-inositolphosphotransferase
MPNETSPRASETEFDYRLAVAKADSRWAIRILQLNRYLNRPLASILVRAVFRTRITPNQVTLAGFVINAAAAGLFLDGRRGLVLWGGILAQLSSIVDCADGMLARSRGQESEFGAALDLVLDRIGEFLVLGSAAAGLYMRSGRPLWLGLGFLAVSVYFLSLTLFYLIKGLRRDERRADTAEMRAWLMLLIGVFGVLGRVDVGLGVLLAAATINVVFHLGDFLFAGRRRRA